MVQQFNLRTTRSASQLLSSVEISSPVAVRHTAGQRPGGATLRGMLASNSASNILTGAQSPTQSRLLGSSSATDMLLSEAAPDSQTTPPAACSPKEKRFSGSGESDVLQAP